MLRRDASPFCRSFAIPHRLAIAPFGAALLDRIKSEGHISVTRSRFIPSRE